MDSQDNDYEKWTERELRRAESVAANFIHENIDTIGESLRARVASLDDLVTRLGRQHLSFDERLHILARIEEISRALQQDAQGFFHMASEQVVARILAQVESKPL